ncbi:MAG TPA: hypothetical protein VK614_08735 [Allosphingosinicella sp.]|nr:hypothetical protein [Allosphingosinicella sp.]
MSWSFNTSDRYHTQDTGYYCGAACAMMILNEIGVPYSNLDQVVLYNSNNSHNAQPNWYTDPYGLCFTLNDRRPASFLPNFFVVYKDLNEAAGTQHVVHTLHHYKVSPAILVYGCAHWNVVCGVQTDVDPGSGPYVVEGFWLNNPVWDSSLSSHNATDTCGSGGAHGIANEFVTYSEWQTNRFNGCSYDDPNGATQWVSVCDPVPPTIAMPRGREVRHYCRGDALLSKDEVEAFARRGLEEYGLLDNKRAKSAFAKGRLREPQLVQRLDRPGDFYYLAPWERDGGIVATVDLDARFGVLKSVRLLDRPAENWMAGISGRNARSAIAKLIENRRFDLGDQQGSIQVFPGTYCIPPVLVWQPCRESWSPHLPFMRIAVGGNSLYIRVDGQVFTHLTSGLGA